MISRVDPGSFVLIAGEEVRGSGRLVRTSEGDWFDPPLAVPAVGYAPGRKPAPRPSEFAIPVDGADFERVAHRFERDGSVEGLATVYGTWLADRISITRQTDERLEQSSPDWTDPPCPPPPGGWPRVPNDSFGDIDADLAELEATGAAVTTVIFRPSRKQTVLTIAAGDIAAVEARLRPRLKDRLCVVPSRWTRAQLDAAEDHLMSMAERWRLYAIGPSCDERAQATMGAELVLVTDEIARWVAGQPDGLVTLEPCLVPIRLLGR